MRAFAVIVGPDGAEVELGHGAIVGRLASAALCVSDPRVSEAHAMVSLRGDRMRLLALRGRLMVGGAPSQDVVLEPGLVVELAPGVSLRVEDVVLPDSALALEGPGLPRQVLSGVCSLFTRPRPRLVPGFSGIAEAVVWGDGPTWRAWLPDGRTRPLAAGDVLEAGGLRVSVVEAQLGPGETVVTTAPDDRIAVVARYETAQVSCGASLALLTGVPARLLTELVAFDGPAPWEALARELWGAQGEREQLRARLDMALLRLRRRLRDAGIREDLVVATGTGQIQLVLRPGDTAEGDP